MSWYPPATVEKVGRIYNSYVAFQSLRRIFFLFLLLHRNPIPRFSGHTGASCLAVSSNPSVAE